jgi:sugar phosphate permease
VRARDVVGYIRDHGWIGYMLLTVICASAAMEVARTTAPALAAEQLGVGEHGAGVIVAAQSLGSAVGVLVFVFVRARSPAVLVATTGLAIQAVGLVVLAASTSLLLASLAVALVGVGFSLSFPVPTSALQKDVDRAYRGRVMAVHQISHLGNRPFSALAIGAIAAAFGLPVAALVAVALAPLGWEALRRGWRGRPDPGANPVTAAA